MEHVPVIGIDLAVTAASELAVASGATIEASRKVASTPKGLTEGIRQAARGRAVAIVVESTAMAWFIAAVAALRSGVEYRLYRVSGRKSAALRAFYRSHTKTDHIDARVLARMPAVDDSLLTDSLPAPSDLAMKRLVVARHKLTTETTKLQNRIRSLLAWAAPGVVKAAGGTVSSGLVGVLGRWSDLTALAKARVATIALQGDWGTERAEAVRTAVARRWPSTRATSTSRRSASSWSFRWHSSVSWPARSLAWRSASPPCTPSSTPRTTSSPSPASARSWPGWSGPWWVTCRASPTRRPSGPTPAWSACLAAGAT